MRHRTIIVAGFAFMHLIASGCSDRYGNLEFPLTDGDSIVVTQSGDRVDASYPGDRETQFSFEIQHRPYGTIASSDFRVLENEHFALLVTHREYLNKLPKSAKASSWAALYLAENLLFIVDVSSGTSHLPGDKELTTKARNAIATKSPDNILGWISRVDLHSTLDEDSVEKLSLLPNLETLVIGRQKVTDLGMKQLLRLGNLRRLNLSRAILATDVLKNLELSSQLDLVLVSEQQEAELQSMLEASALPFAVRVAKPD